MKRVLILTLALIACGGTDKRDASHARFPPLPEGCTVIEYQEAPIVATHNIGRVRASCGRSASTEECRRTLKDEVCKLGGDVVWEVKSAEGEDDRTILTGRAAHTKN